MACRAMTADPARCPRCQMELPAGAILCPRCLVGLALTPAAPAPAGAPPPPSLAELQPLFPAFELQALLGRGGMGAVYRARHLKFDRTVAIKVLLPDLVADPAFAERFEREARALALLDHRGIVGIHDFGRAGPFFHLVMEFVDGASLRDLLAQGRLTPREVLSFVPQLCDALQYAHDHRVVHRDIKPENILVDQEGRVRIADFGLAKLLGHEPSAVGLTLTAQAMGTPHYMAPEQVQAAATVDHRADLYSLGVVLYEMLTGALPIGRFQPPSAKAATPPSFDPVVMKSLENDPAQRYQKANDVKRAVEAAGTVDALRDSYRESRSQRDAARRRHVQPLPWRPWAAALVVAIASAMTWVSYDVATASLELGGRAATLVWPREGSAWNVTAVLPCWYVVVFTVLAAAAAALRPFRPVSIALIVVPTGCGFLQAGFVLLQCLHPEHLHAGPGLYLTMFTLLVWTVIEVRHRDAPGVRRRAHAPAKPAPRA